jgi:hypothetical protein
MPPRRVHALQIAVSDERLEITRPTNQLTPKPRKSGLAITGRAAAKNERMNVFAADSRMRTLYSIPCRSLLTHCAGRVPVSDQPSVHSCQRHKDRGTRHTS